MYDAFPFTTVDSCSVQDVTKDQFCARGEKKKFHCVTLYMTQVFCNIPDVIEEWLTKDFPHPRINRDLGCNVPIIQQNAISL